MVTSSCNDMLFNQNFELMPFLFVFYNDFDNLGDHGMQNSDFPETPGTLTQIYISLSFSLNIYTYERSRKPSKKDLYRGRTFYGANFLHDKDCHSD